MRYERSHKTKSSLSSTVKKTRLFVTPEISVNPDTLLSDVSSSCKSSSFILLPLCVIYILLSKLFKNASFKPGSRLPQGHFNIASEGPRNRTMILQGTTCSTSWAAADSFFFRCWRGAGGPAEDGQGEERRAAVWRGEGGGAILFIYLFIFWMKLDFILVHSSILSCNPVLPLHFHLTVWKLKWYKDVSERWRRQSEMVKGGQRKGRRCRRRDAGGAREMEGGQGGST